jgi:hypothetical protein
MSAQSLTPELAADSARTYWRGLGTVILTALSHFRW